MSSISCVFFQNAGCAQEMVLVWQKMKPTLTEGGPEALTFFGRGSTRGTPFTLILPESQMPSTDGFRIGETIKRDVRLARSGVILLTLAGLSGDAVLARRCYVETNRMTCSPKFSPAKT